MSRGGQDREFPFGPRCYRQGEVRPFRQFVISEAKAVEEAKRAGQIVGMLRVLAAKPEGVTPQGIIDELMEKGAELLPAIACDANSGVPLFGSVLEYLFEYRDAGLLQADSADRWSFTPEGRQMVERDERRRNRRMAFDLDFEAIFPLNFQ
jgi:hypothetical protein